MKRLLPILAAFALCGCSILTVTPKIVEPTHASIEGNSANSGVLGRLPDGSYHLTAVAVVHYNRLIYLGYGRQFLAPLTAFDGTKMLADGSFSMDQEHVVDYGIMLADWRSAGKP